VTCQSATSYGLSPGESAKALASIMSSTASSWSTGEELLTSTPENSSGNLVGDHIYMITDVNAANDTFTIQNPWNTAYSGPLAMSFTETIQPLAHDNCSLYAASRHPVAWRLPSGTRALLGVLCDLCGAAPSAAPRALRARRGPKI
jgi:hypothetical protein